MSEVTFAKTFLATLDKRPIKLPADHVGDPRKYPSQSPFILPKNTHPFPARSKPSTTSTSQRATLTATLKPMRSSGETLALPDTTLDTTIHDLKTAYAEKTGAALEKIKLLLNKKPAADLKTLKELGVREDAGSVELSVMIMGGGTTPGVQSPEAEKGDPTPAVPAPAPAAATAGTDGEKMDVDPKASAPMSEKAEMEAEKSTAGQAGTAKEVLKTEEFWQDLKGFLAQRLRSQDEGEAVAGVFREAWERS